MSEATIPTRSARIEARLPPEALTVIRRAAEIQGRTVSDFVVAAAQEAARQAIEDAQIIRLSVADQQALAAGVLDPATPSEALRRAMQRHRDLIANQG